VFFDLDTVVLDAAQALCIALPAAGMPAVLLRLGGRGWALLAPLSLVGTLVAIYVAPTSADVLSWVALLLVPPGCALALGWAIHGARPRLALLTIPSSRRPSRCFRSPRRSTSSSSSSTRSPTRRLPRSC
jgi:hypothetical protein